MNTRCDWFDTHFAYSVEQEWTDVNRLIACGCSDVVQIASRSIDECTLGREFYKKEFTLHVVSHVVATLTSFGLDFFVVYYRKLLVGARCLSSSTATRWLFNVFGVISAHWRDEPWCNRFRREEGTLRTLCALEMGAESVVLLRCAIDEYTFVSLSHVLLLVLCDELCSRRTAALQFVSLWSRQVQAMLPLAHPGDLPPHGALRQLYNLVEPLYHPIPPSGAIDLGSS